MGKIFEVKVHSDVEKPDMPVATGGSETPQAFLLFFFLYFLFLTVINICCHYVNNFAFTSGLMEAFFDCICRKIIEFILIFFFSADVNECDLLE